MEDKKIIESTIGQKDIVFLNLKDIAFFKDNPFYLYLYKKNQKVASAIYMLTDIMDEREPIRWSLRNLSLKLTSSSMELNRSEFSQSNSNKAQIIFSLISLLLELESLFEIGINQMLISEMNFSIIKRELDHLIQLIHQKQQPLVKKTDLILSEDMLKTEEEKQLPGKQYEKLLLSSVQSAQNIPGQQSTAPKIFFKGQKKDMSYMISDIVSLTPKNDTGPKINNDIADKKNDRKEIIISLLQNGKQLMIKDFTDQIKDCGEKTIQRELSLLVSTGFLKKIGERRWSKYALA